MNYKWHNPIIIEFIRYHNSDPFIALKKEVDYLFKISNIQLSPQNYSVDIDKIAKNLGLKDNKFDIIDEFYAEGIIFNDKERIK